MSSALVSLTKRQIEMDSTQFLNQGLKRLTRKNETGIFMEEMLLKHQF